MLLRRKTYDYKTLIGWGQVAFLLGVLCSRLAAGGFIGGWLETLPEQTLVELLQGFAAGLSIPLLGASIYLNIWGLRLYRSS